MRARTRRVKVLGRVAGAGLAAGVMVQGCGVTVDVPGLSAQISPGGALVDFLLGSVEVSERGVFVDAPFVEVNIYAP